MHICLMGKVGNNFFMDLSISQDIQSNFIRPDEVYVHIDFGLLGYLYHVCVKKKKKL